MADAMDVVEGTPPPAESSDASAVRIAPGFRSMVHLTEGADSPASSAPASPAPFVDSVLPSSDVERPPSEKVERLEAKLARDPYDEVTWTALIGEAVNHNEAYTKSVFERMVAVFPTSVRTFTSPSLLTDATCVPGSSLAAVHRA